MFQWRPPATIVVKSLGLARRADEILVESVPADDGTIKGWRLPGGSVEFMETGADAVIREFREEFAAYISIAGPPTVYENFYRHHDAPGHEVLFIFPVAFNDPVHYERPPRRAERTVAETRWTPIAAFTDGGLRLFPEVFAQQLIGGIVSAPV